MTKIAVFGATGQTGQEVLKKALKHGYHINALARNPQKSPVKDDRIKWVKGDILNLGDVLETVSGAEGVLSVFGHVKGSPARLQTIGTQHILAAMDQHNLSRLISLSGGGLPYHKDKPRFADHMIRGLMKLITPKMLNDAIEHAEVLEASETQWTIVRGPRLVNQEEKGSYKVTWVGIDAGTSVTRADLADFILQDLESKSYVRQMPFVTN